MALVHPVRVIAVDWSGAAAGAARAIWIARVDDDGRLDLLENGRTREGVRDWLIAEGERAAREGRRLVVGLDFAFSMPAWFVRACGCADGPGLWRTVAAGLGERWLRECPPPLFGRAGTKRPTDVDVFRQTEIGLSAKSVLQIAGAGSVGTGSIRGMAVLAALVEAGWGVWPFVDGAAGHVAVEIYPRLCTGPVVKTDAAARRAFVRTTCGDRLGRFAGAAAASDDAFDAAISALVMYDHAADLAGLRAAGADAVERVEGAIWRPRGPLGGSGTG